MRSERGLVSRIRGAVRLFVLRLSLFSYLAGLAFSTRSLIAVFNRSCCM